MKKIIFTLLFFLAAAPLLLFQETNTVFKNNNAPVQKKGRGRMTNYKQITKKMAHELHELTRIPDKKETSIMTAFNQKLLPGVQGGGFLEKSPPGLYMALAVGYHGKSDQYFKQVYGNGTANYTVEAGYWLIRNLAVGIKLSYLNKKGKTLLLQSETSLRQVPVMGYLKAGFGLARGWKGYGALGFGYIFFKEESYIGTIEDSAPGWGLESGLEYSFTKKLYLLWAVGFQSFKKTFPELNETQQLGGVDIRIGIGIRVF
ncbi:MAG: outer membrane beta-barrel protein [Candidatus Aminicenantes bacterium]|jgi:hypothetical protein